MTQEEYTGCFGCGFIFFFCFFILLSYLFLHFFVGKTDVTTIIWPLTKHSSYLLDVNLRYKITHHDLNGMEKALAEGAMVDGWHEMFPVVEPPLYVAAKEGYMEGVKILLRHHANPNHSAYPGPKSPLAGAVFGDSRRYDPHIADLLLQNGANPNITIAVGMLWAKNITPIRLAMEHGDRRLARVMQRRGAVIDQDVAEWLSSSPKR